MRKSRSDRYQLAEKALGQNLRTWVRTRFYRGESWRTIALALRDATHIDIAPETLRLWFDDMKRPEKSKQDGAVA